MVFPGRQAAIAWPTLTVGLPSHGKQRKHHQVVAEPPDVTPAVDHHVRLANTLDWHRRAELSGGRCRRFS
jgi:hypothetical protein